LTPVDWALAVGLALSLGLVLALHRRQASLERQLRRRVQADFQPPPQTALQHVGLVRYRAFNDVGGDHSFALALLDGNGDGIVINGLYHRERCRVYAKPVRVWAGDQPLTEEEGEAVQKARPGDPSVDTGGPSLVKSP